MVDVVGYDLSIYEYLSLQNHHLFVFVELIYFLSTGILFLSLSYCVDGRASRFCYFAVVWVFCVQARYERYTANGKW